MSGSVGIVDEGGTQIINESALPTTDIMDALMAQHPEVAAMTKWSGGLTSRGSNSSGKGNLFNRDRYVTPNRIFDQMDVARYAAIHDDVVSGVIDATESLAFSRMSIECEDSDQEDIWNQIAMGLDLDRRLREMWRELSTVSQFYIFQWWGTKSFKVRGKSAESGVKRKKTIANLRVPIGMTILDPKKIIPIGSGFFNQERLLYVPSSRDEADIIDEVLSGKRVDPIIDALITGKYDIGRKEFNKMKSDFDLSVDRVYECNSRNVWRHTMTKPQYQNFADVRMVPIFELLDMKTQLREMDRAYLLGSTNFIILIKKGSDALPAKPEEVQNLQANVRMLARVPVIVGDHRLSIEIVTPKLDMTLKGERYDVLDARIAIRMYQMFMSPGMGPRSIGDDSIKLGRVIARGLESRRHMLRRSLEERTLKLCMEANAFFTEDPSLEFHPRQITLDFDPALANFYMDLRDRNELSRDTVLAQIDIDQDVEARKRDREAKSYDKIFETQVPFSGQKPQGEGPPTDPRTGGRNGGGNRNRGGSAPGSGQGQAPKNPAKTSDGPKSK